VNPLVQVGTEPLTILHLFPSVARPYLQISRRFLGTREDCFNACVGIFFGGTGW